MKWKRILSLLIVSVLITGGLAIIGSEPVEAHENHPDTVTFGVTMDRTSTLLDVSAGDVDLFLQSLEATIYDGMDPSVKAQIGVWESSGGYNNWYINPAYEGDGTDAMQDAIDAEWIDGPEDIQYEANDADGEWQFNPFSVQEVRYALNHLDDRQAYIEDLQDGFGDPRYIWEATGTGTYIEYFEDIVEGGDPDPEDGQFGMTPTGDQDFAVNYAFDALNEIADDEDALMGDLRHPDDADTDFWEYQAPDGDWEPVEFTIAIREEDWRLEQGQDFGERIEEYFQFEFEPWIASRATLSPQVFAASPEPFDNLPFHIYTGGWLASAAVAYPDVSLRQMYSPAYGFVFPQVQEGHWSYADTEGGQLMNELTLPPFTGAVEDEDEYWWYMQEAVKEAINESIRVYTVTETNFFTYNDDSIIRAVPNVVTGWDQIYAPRTIEPSTPGDHLEARYFSAEGALYMDNWNWYGGSEGAYGANQRRWVLGQETWNHPTSGEAVEMKSSWTDPDTGEITLERGDYEIDEETGAVTPLTELPETALEYDLETHEWVTVDEYYEDGGYYATSATIYMSEGEWHDGSEHGLHTIAEYWGRLKNMVYESPEDEWADYYYAPHADAVAPWWANVQAIEFHPEDNAYTIYGNNIHPADTQVTQYYTLNPRTSQPVYESIKQEVYETDYSIHEDTTFGWDSGEAEVYVHLMGAGQAEDYYVPTMGSLIEEDFVPPYVDATNDDALPEELKFTAEEYGEKLQAAIDFFEENNNLFISYGPYYFSDNEPAITEIQLTKFDGYTDYNPWDKWVEAFDIVGVDLFNFDFPETVEHGEDIEVSAVGVIEQLFPEIETSPIDLDDDLFPEQATLTDLITGEQLVEENLTRDVGEEDTAFEATLSSDDTLPGQYYEVEMVIGLEEAMADARVVGEIYVDSPVDVIDWNVDPTELDVGDTTTISATLNNTDTEEDQDVPLFIDDEEVTSWTVPADDEKDITYNHTFEEPGEFEVRLLDESTDVSVGPILRFVSPNILRADLEPVSLTIGEGETVEITADVANDGVQAGDINLTIGDELIGEWTIEPGETEEISEEYEFDEFGVYEVKMDGEWLDAQTVTVEAQRFLWLEDLDVDPLAIGLGDEAVITGDISHVAELGTPADVHLEIYEWGQEEEVIDEWDWHVEAGERLIFEETNLFDMDDYDEGNYNVTMHGEGLEEQTVEIELVEDPADFEWIEDLAVDPTVGEEPLDVDITAELENVGQTWGSVTLEIDEEEIESWDVDPGETVEIDEAYTFEDAGEYDVTITGAYVEDQTVTVNVEEPPEAEFEWVEDLAVDGETDELEIEEGDEVEITAEIENVGDADGDVVLEVNGEEWEYTIDAGTTLEIEETYEFEDEGEYDVTLLDQTVTVTVEEEEEEETPGFTLALLVLGAVVAIAIYYKKEQ